MATSEKDSGAAEFDSPVESAANELMPFSPLTEQVLLLWDMTVEHFIPEAARPKTEVRTAVLRVAP